MGLTDSTLKDEKGAGLVEAVARAICAVRGHIPDRVYERNRFAWQWYGEDARAALAAITSAGLAIVPVDALRDLIRCEATCASNMVVPQTEKIVAERLAAMLQAAGNT